MPSLGTPELLVILAIVVLFFGASRLPRLGHAIGSAIANLRDGFQSHDRE